MVIEIMSVVVTGLGVLVALGLGAYGICRDKSAAALLRREQALQVIFLVVDRGNTAEMRAVNASGAAITDVSLWYRTIGNQVDDAGEEIEVAAVRPLLLPGEEFAREINIAEADLSEGFFRLDFIDAQGQGWMKPLGSSLVMVGLAPWLSRLSSQGS